MYGPVYLILQTIKDWTISHPFKNMQILSGLSFFSVFHCPSLARRSPALGMLQIIQSRALINQRWGRKEKICFMKIIHWKWKDRCLNSKLLGSILKAVCQIRFCNKYKYILLLKFGRIQIINNIEYSKIY